MPKNLTFNADFTLQMVEVPIIDDDIVEHSEIINLTLVSTDSAVITPSTSTITIEDVDSKLLCKHYLLYIIIVCRSLYIHMQAPLQFIHIYHFSGYNWIQQNSLFCE